MMVKTTDFVLLGAAKFSDATVEQYPYLTVLYLMEL